jgi:hypothetical protein
LWYPTTHNKDGEKRTRAIPGYEFSGVIAAVGGETIGFEIGLEVYGIRPVQIGGHGGDHAGQRYDSNQHETHPSHSVGPSELLSTPYCAPIPELIDGEASAERERERLHAGIEELDLEPSIDDRLRPAGGLDGAVKEKTILDTPVRELRYQLAL